jgi:1-deoxy-D-xylulose-5-phosphate synthase
MVAPCVALAEKLDATLVNMRFVKPLDEDLLRRLAATHQCIVTVEENAVAGGAGSAVSECLDAAGIVREVHRIGIPDRFIEHGSREDCLAMAGLDAAGLERTFGRIWPARTAPLAVAGGRPGAA